MLIRKHINILYVKQKSRQRLSLTSGVKLQAENWKFVYMRPEYDIILWCKEDKSFTAYLRQGLTKADPGDYS